MTKPVKTFTDGPSMTVLHHRLTDYPSEWVNSGVPSYFKALIHDVVYQFDPQVSAAELQPFQRTIEQSAWYDITLLMAFLLSEEAFAKIALTRASLCRVFTETAKELQQAGTVKRYVQDVDRREEFIRVVLNALELRPAEESDTEAAHRLTACSSVARLKVIEAAKAAEQRAQEIRRALAEQRAREAADKMSRE